MDGLQCYPILAYLTYFQGNKVTQLLCDCSTQLWIEDIEYQCVVIAFTARGEEHFLLALKGYVCRSNLG